MRSRAWRALSSLRLTIALLALLCVVVAASTLAQRSLGTYGAVKAYFRSPLIWWAPAGSPRRIPVFPGGGLIGVLLLVNLLAAQTARLSLAGRKTGLGIVHLGLILLFDWLAAFVALELAVMALGWRAVPASPPRPAS